MILAGYHAIKTRFKIAPKSIAKLFVVDRRNDLKVKSLFQLAKKNNVQVIRVSSLELTRLTMNKKNSVCAAFVKQLTRPTSLEELFDLFRIQGNSNPPIIPTPLLISLTFEIELFFNKFVVMSPEGKRSSLRASLQADLI